MLSLKVRFMMSDLYNLSDDELLSTDVSELVLDEVTNENEVETENTTADGHTEQSDSDTEHDGTDVPNDEPESVQSDTEQSETQEANTEVDYEAFYQTMTTPFKANGREISIGNADDAIKLMQMGANYSKKMEQLKPKQALLKVLEENKLDNKEQLGYLIDLAQKKPEAIAKLIKESNIDLYEFDTDLANDYQPNLEIKEATLFEETLQELLTSNSGMYDVINDMSKWDNESKDVIFAEPQMLRLISEQKANGLYDTIINTIETEKMFGRMVGMPFLQAYATIEQQLVNKNNQSNKFTAPRPNNNKTNNSTDKRRKAGLPNTNSSTVQEQFNPLTVSDEELLKMLT